MTARRGGLRIAVVLGIGLLCSISPARALPAERAFPTKELQLLVPFTPGGGVDLAGRTVARLLVQEKIVTTPIIVINRAGAGGAVGMTEMIARHKGDGYTAMIIATHIHSTPLSQGSQLSHASFTPLARLFAEYQLLVVRPESPFRTLRDVADALRRDPGAVKLGGAAIASADHITAARFAKALGINPARLTFIAYSGGEGNAAILGGHLDVGVGGPDVQPFIESGKMRALAVSSPVRLGGTLKDVPTFREQGYDVVQANWRGAFGPPDMPATAAGFWKDALGALAKTPAWKAELEKQQWVDAFDNTGFAADLKQEYEVYRSILTDLGLVK